MLKSKVKSRKLGKISNTTNVQGYQIDHSQKEQNRPLSWTVFPPTVPALPSTFLRQWVLGNSSGVYGMFAG